MLCSEVLSYLPRSHMNQTSLLDDPILLKSNDREGWDIRDGVDLAGLPVEQSLKFGVFLPQMGCDWTTGTGNHHRGCP